MLGYSGKGSSNGVLLKTRSRNFMDKACILLYIRHEKSANYKVFNLCHFLHSPVLCQNYLTEHYQLQSLYVTNEKAWWVVKHLERSSTVVFYDTLPSSSFRVTMNARQTQDVPRDFQGFVSFADLITMYPSICLQEDSPPNGNSALVVTYDQFSAVF
jgi:hypothetical protein